MWSQNILYDISHAKKSRFVKKMRINQRQFQAVLFTIVCLPIALLIRRGKGRSPIRGYHRSIIWLPTCEFLPNPSQRKKLVCVSQDPADQAAGNLPHQPFFKQN